MAEKLIIIMANTDTRNGEELGAPIFHAPWRRPWTTRSR